MDYQYKSINRGPHSIFSQISSQGVDPTDHIFVFNLRAYDRINKTPALEELEKEAGVTYNDIQRGIAEALASEAVHPTVGKEGDQTETSYEDTQKEKEKRIAQLQKYEERNKAHEAHPAAKNKDTLAHATMLNGGKLSDEVWEGDPEREGENYVQEELYVHGKVCIVDDRVMICGSSNINDRVTMPLLPILENAN
jgi:phospholipase D1/2